MYARTPIVISQQQSGTLTGAPSVGPAPSAASQLDALASVVRGAVGMGANWADTAQLVASALERHLPSASVLTAEQRTGDPGTYKSDVLHSDPMAASRSWPLSGARDR